MMGFLRNRLRRWLGIEQIADGHLLDPLAPLVRELLATQKEEGRGLLRRTERELERSFLHASNKRIATDDALTLLVARIRAMEERVRALEAALASPLDTESRRNT